MYHDLHLYRLQRYPGHTTVPAGTSSGLWLLLLRPLLQVCNHFWRYATTISLIQPLLHVYNPRYRYIPSLLQVYNHYHKYPQVYNHDVIYTFAITCIPLLQAYNSYRLLYHHCGYTAITDIQFRWVYSLYHKHTTAVTCINQLLPAKCLEACNYCYSCTRTVSSIKPQS